MTKRYKRSFQQTWLTDVRYKSWIRKVSSNDSFYYCNVCNKNFSCITSLPKHAKSAYHNKRSFQQAWLTDERYKS